MTFAEVCFWIVAALVALPVIGGVLSLWARLTARGWYQGRQDVTEPTNHPSITNNQEKKE